jgi:hypothetical protein
MIIAQAWPESGAAQASVEMTLVCSLAVLKA